MEKKKIEKIIIAVIFIGCMIWIFVMKYYSLNGTVAHISVNGELETTLDMKYKRHFFIKGENDITVEIECIDGQIRVVSSECPDKICVKKGFISMTDENIVCMPAKLIITVDKAKPGERGEFGFD